ncbi:tRNA dihydrouridine(20/20a) synthase DusA [Parasutterella excrementihominis]|uniref:tRNA dihydrouridine(20/20a) synthase DusA n=1 Tax=Parasutterella excrementihominis TaxID=487175 RepID=UPI003A8ECDA6
MTDNVYDPIGWRFCVAPMLDLTDRHCRYFHRLLSHRARLYTEMVTTGALVHGDVPHHLDFSEAEHRVALQLGGSDPKDLAHGAKLAQQWGYDEVNLNCGCPSERVQKGSFGACLMAEPGLVADCVKAMQDATHLPVTIKHRVGIDANNDYGFVRDFVGTLFNAGVRVFIVHARNAWLKGLSPKENREIPPLRREVVYQLKKDFPEAIIVINGALQDLGECEAELKHVDGVMLGRAAYYTPWLLTDVDARLYNDEHAPVTRDRVIDAMEEYVRFIKPDDHPLRACCRHMHGLLTGLAGAKVWRRTLSDTALIREQGADIFRYAYGKAGWADVESFPDEDREFFS